MIADIWTAADSLDCGGLLWTAAARYSATPLLGSNGIVSKSGVAEYLAAAVQRSPPQSKYPPQSIVTPRLFKERRIELVSRH
jgi:hypothetical protein